MLEGNEMTVRLAIIGAGIMGSDHAGIFAAEIPGATISVICDADERRARAIADTSGAFDVATDAASVISRPDVDAVVVASPDHTHAPLTVACIRAGKPVLCEKPLSQSSAECESVVAAEVAAGRRLVQLGFMRRFDQSYVELKAALDEGAIGRALMMHNFHRNVETPATDFTGAMAITNSAPHEFDVVRYVLAAEISAISARQPNRSDRLVAPVVMVLETSSDQVVTIEVNNNAGYGYDVRCELVGETGSVDLVAPVSSRRNAALRSATAYPADWRGRFREAYRRQNSAFLRFVETGVFSPIASTAFDGFIATRIAVAGVAALDQGRRIAIDPVAAPAFYQN